MSDFAFKACVSLPSIMSIIDVYYILLDLTVGNFCNELWVCRSFFIHSNSIIIFRAKCLAFAAGIPLIFCHLGPDFYWIGITTFSNIIW